jgi:hypothetical protein
MTTILLTLLWIGVLTIIGVVLDRERRRRGK